MTSTARDENIATLQLLVGLDASKADAVVDARAVLTVGNGNARPVADLICRLLQRTIKDVREDPAEFTAVEIIVGDAQPRTTAPKVWVMADGLMLRIGTRCAPSGPFCSPPIFNLIAACHAAATAVRLLAPAGRLTFTDPILVDPAAIMGGSLDSISRQTRFGKTFLAGAGAVGNAFVFALGMLDVEGELHIVDPDIVTDGNLNRTLLFELDDIGQPKVSVLVRRAAPFLPGVRLVPRMCRIQDLEERGPHAWLERLVVGVDSRRARRRLQDELPLHVFDASTTGIAEAVLTFGTAGSNYACMGCLYPLDLVENQHESHIASVLGVSVEDVQTHHVSEAAALAIATLYPSLSPKDLVPPGRSCTGFSFSPRLGAVRPLERAIVLKVPGDVRFNLGAEVLL